MDQRIYDALLGDVAQSLWTFGPGIDDLTADLELALAADVWVFSPDHEQTLLVCHPVRGWVMPGGHVERGETVRAAAVREVAEETGLAIDEDGLRPVALHWGPGKLGLSYTAEIDPEHPLSGEPQQPAQWWSLEDEWPSTYPHDRYRLRRHVAVDRILRAGIDVRWSPIVDLQAFAISAVEVGAPDVLPAVDCDGAWQLADVPISSLRVDRAMVARHEARAQHRTRRDGFVELVLSGTEVPPLLVLGDERALVDGYARMRALLVLGQEHVQVVRIPRISD